MVLPTPWERYTGTSILEAKSEREEYDCPLVQIAPPDRAQVPSWAMEQMKGA